MPYALTQKSQVTVPKAVRQALGVEPGQSVDYEVLADGRVVMVAAPTPRQPDVRATLRKWRGTGVSGMSTDEIMCETRGEDWNRA